MDRDVPRKRALKNYRRRLAMVTWLVASRRFDFRRRNAAIGAGRGLGTGGAAGIGAAQASGLSLQRRYDMGYLQCMSAKGENVPAASASYPGYSWYPPYYPYYPPYYPYYPGYYGPAFFG